MSGAEGPAPAPAVVEQHLGARSRMRRRGMRILVVVVVAFGGGGLTGAVLSYRLGSDPAGLSSGLPRSGPGGVAGVEGVAGRVLPSVVQLRVLCGDRGSTGSGVLLSSDGLILTNNHVAAAAAGGAGQITVLFQDGTSRPATIIGRDPSSDIAVVKATNVSGLTPITLGDSEQLQVGQPVVAVGSPLGLGGTVTTGIISAVHRAALAQDTGPSNDSGGPEVLDAIQTDAALNPGNSGGPLLDMTGRLIGINTAIFTFAASPGQQAGSVGIGFAIPINEVTRIATELQRNGHATKPLLGAKMVIQDRLAPLTDPPGARIVEITPPTGPAGKAGLKAGDLVVKLNDRAITTGAELIAAIRSHAPGDTITLQLGDRHTVTVVLGSQPVPATK